NRPQRRQAAPGAPSRGVLPLLAVQHGQDWPAYVDLVGMASFALLLVAPEVLTLWVFDGESLTSTALPAGTHMVTSGGAEDGKAGRYLDVFASASTAAQWCRVVTGHTPQDDPAALVVRHEKDGFVYATVFGQVIDCAPGALTLTCSRTPWVEGTWLEHRWSL
ncbi:MAG: hypothetical protein WCD35_06220, partial [Mycobacteriales bacterium]